MNSGDILVHSNQDCDGGNVPPYVPGRGGFEIYNVIDPTNPVHLASVQTDDVNAFLRDNFTLTDLGVNNVFLFTQGSKDYVAAVVNSDFGNFQIFDITNPRNPLLVGYWGAEQLNQTEVTDWASLDDEAIINEARAYLNDGYGDDGDRFLRGDDQDRFLRDITITADGKHAYLSNFDAGLVLLDISDPTSTKLVSVALDLSADGDMEVNSNAAWPSEDGKIVVETNEDFYPSERPIIFTIDSGPSAGQYNASEGRGEFTVPIVFLPEQEMSGPATYVGLACTGGDAFPPATGSGQIALIQRGICRFDEKSTEVINAGYAGMVVFNDETRGDDVIFMIGDRREIPGAFVGHSAGLKIAKVTNATELVIGASGEKITAAAGKPNGWGQVRIWDYSDPTNPVFASSFDTVCSAAVGDTSSCDPAGIYTAKNVIVQTTGNRVKAYISWYSDGMLILDATDPYHPVEIARYTGSDGEQYWGVYKEDQEPWIYGSDRNGGLDVFKEYGAGTIATPPKEDCGDINNKPACEAAECKWHKKANPKCSAGGSQALSNVEEADTKEQPSSTGYAMTAASAWAILHMLMLWSILSF